MDLDPALCYRAVLARDARFDGLFFTCVRTTRVYCRPICPARPPRLENCIFVQCAAAAQEAGFRPCLRCHPESSPSLWAWHGTMATVSRALHLIEGGALDEARVEDLAARLGVGARHLSRLFRRHLGASPIAVAQTRRVLLARQLMHQTGLSMAQIAMASGFGSVRRFNESFRRIYGRSPGKLRHLGGRTDAPTAISLLLPYRSPYDWNSMLAFLGARAIPGVETVTGVVYRRTIQIGEATGWIQVERAAERAALRATVHISRLDTLPVIIACIRRLFDLGADPTAIEAQLRADPTLGPMVAARPGLRVPGGWNGFEIATRAILGQQITVGAATRLAGALAAAFGDRLACAAPDGLTHTFPRPQKISADGVAIVGMPQARARAVVGLARALCSDPGLFDPRQDLAATTANFTRLPGIGEWTAQYIAIRGMRESDAFPASDLGLLRAFAEITGRRVSARELLEHAERWRPWRAYAAVHLWSADAARRNRVRESSAEAAHAVAV